MAFICFFCLVAAGLRGAGTICVFWVTCFPINAFTFVNPLVKWFNDLASNFLFNNSDNFESLFSFPVSIFLFLLIGSSSDGVESDISNSGSWSFDFVLFVLRVFGLGSSDSL